MSNLGKIQHVEIISCTYGGSIVIRYCSIVKININNTSHMRLLVFHTRFYLMHYVTTTITLC